MLAHVKKPGKSQRSTCPIANSLDFLGDRWTLVVIRDLMFRDRHEYGELLSAGEGISTSVLADRLERLQCAGLVTKTPHPRDLKKYRYHLTDQGIDLMPVLVDLTLWGLEHVPGATAPPDLVRAMKRDRAGFIKKATQRLRNKPTS